MLSLAHSAYQDDLTALRAVVGEAQNIRVMTETVSEPELRGLMAASDVVGGRPVCAGPPRSVVFLSNSLIRKRRYFARRRHPGLPMAFWS
jgi:hypothetical protein